jgi:hypothetical protein
MSESGEQKELPHVDITKNSKNPNDINSKATRRMNDYCNRASRHYYHQVKADVRRHHRLSDEIRSSTVTNNVINHIQTPLHSETVGTGKASEVVDEAATKIDEYISFDHYIGITPSITFKHGPPLALIADQVALPACAGGVKLLSVLPSEVVAHYIAFDKNIIKRDRIREMQVQARVHAKRSEYIKLIQRMKQAGMLIFRDTEPYVINGMFGVRKDVNEQRLILDARPSNAMMVDPPWFNLPTPDLLADIQIRKKQLLYVAKCDISNMFHQFALPQDWYPWFGMPSITTHDVGMELDKEARRIWPCCITLPMGWAHSPYLAQTAHIYVATTHGGLLSYNQLCIGNDLCMDRIRYMIFIDDISWIGDDLEEMIRQQLSYEAGAARINLPTKPSKRIAPTSTGVEVIGILLDGEHHTISLRPSKMHQLVIDTKELLEKGECSGHELMQVMGRWTWAALVRRPTLSVMRSCYWFARRYYDTTHTITTSVRRELMTMCGLAPVLITRLSIPFTPYIIATDASSTGQGVTSIEAGTDIQYQMQVSKHAMKCNSYTRHNMREDVLSASLQDEFKSSMLATWIKEHTKKWSTIVSYQWKYHDQHINQLEARAVQTALEWMSSRPIAHSSRITLLTDSAAVYYAVKKGRSSSPSLSKPLQRLAAIMLANNIYLYIQWIPTTLNPSDAASRGVISNDL